MILIRLFSIFSLFLSVFHVSSSSSSDIVHLKNHFIANLIEENRDISSSLLTDDIEQRINLKIEGFLDILSTPSTRSRRKTNELLLNEKTADIFILKGLDGRGYVPVNFPEDICLFHINRKIFAVTLSRGHPQNETSGTSKPSGGTLSIFIRDDGKFLKIHEYKSRFLTKIDCQAASDAGYVAVVNTISESDYVESEQLFNFGSFVYKIIIQPSGVPKVEIFQKIALLNQNGVRLWSREQNMYLIYSYNTNSSSLLMVCTIFKLVRSHFDPMDNLPCQNARIIEFFTVHHDLMVLIGNYQENNGTTNAFSSIMRYDLEQQRFVEHQKISTSAITVGKYFYLDHQEQRQHFLFIGNSFEINEFGVINYDVPSIIYKLVKGFFIPMQTVNVKHIQAMLPIVGKNNEFHLLIASENHEVQIYFYDGWKFHESPIDFTGNAFGDGIVTMRAYDDIINGTTIVVSNRNSFDSADNVYTPIYTMKNDSSKLKSSITKWCSDAFDRLESFDVDEADDVLKSALELADPLSDHANFMGKVFMKNSTITTINTNEFRGTRVVFTNETAQRYNSLSDRISKLSSAVQHVHNKIKFTKATRRSRRQAPMLIKNLIVDGSLNIQSINNLPVSDLVYKSNRRNKNLKDIVAKEILIKNQLFVNEKIDGIELTTDNVILNQQEQELRPLAIENLSVMRISDATTVNAVPFNEFFTLLRRKVDVRIPNMIDQLNVDSMTIGRFLNGKNFTSISINSLKTSGDQVLTARTNIGVLRAKKIIFQKVLRNQKISNVALSMLININETRKRQIIDQDVRFIEPLEVNRLFVRERINNIKVIDGQLQVLRKRGPSSQVVNGEKFFDEVHLLSPIVLRGKIESRTLEKMNPIISINEDLVLEGDYTISGPVVVRRVMNASGDIKTNNPGLSLKNLVDNGLNLFTTNETANKFVFQNVVEVKRNLQVQSLSGKPVESFVKMNYPDMQIIRGLTTFRNGLLVHGGTVQADNINDIDVNLLNKTILKRFSSTPQIVDGNIEIVSLKVPQLFSPDVKLIGKNIDLVLNANRKQDVSQMVFTQANVRNLKATNMIQNSDGKIFGTNLNALINDTVTKDSSKDSTYIASKTFKDLNVEHLAFSEKNEWKSIIANYENSIAKDLNFTGDLKFEKDMRIGNLIFSGTINGVSYDDMLNNWLQAEGSQVFTAPQTIKAMTVEGKLYLATGNMNGADVGKMIKESIWIDEPIYVENMVIDGEVVVRGKTVSPTVNGIVLDGKFLLNNTNVQQKLHKLIVERNAAAEYINFTNLNGIDCERFTRALNGANDTENLLIRGSASFNYQPATVALNNVNLEQLHESIWLKDRDVVLTGEDIQFLGGARSDSAIYSDTLNQKDLQLYDREYFSLTKNQNIGSYLNINGSMIVKKSLSTQKTILQGSIKTDINEKGLKLEDFANKILRLGQEQAVTGNWKVKKLIIDGDFEGTINGFNFKDDVLHTGNWETAEVTGCKKMKSIDTYDVKTQYVNAIHIPHWLEDAVSLNSSVEQYIDGKIEMSDAVFYDNIQVDGPVNGIVINPETILTKSGDGQEINGDVTIKTMTPQSMKQLFIDNLYLQNGINGKNLAEIYQNTLKTSDTKIDSKRIIFDKHLIAGSVETGKSIYGVNMADFLARSDASNQLVTFQNNMKYLTHVGESLKASHLDVAMELGHFEHHQSLHGVDIQKTIPFTIVAESSIDYAIAVLDRNTNSSFEKIKFYRWNRETHSFINDDSMNPLQYDVIAYRVSKVGKVVYKGVDHLFVEIFDKTNKQYLQSLMILDPPSKNFVAALQSDSQFSAELFTLNDGSSVCYGSIFPSFANLAIICEGAQTTILETPPVRMVSSQNGMIILLTDDHQLQIWYEQKVRQVLKVMNPQSFTSIRYNGKFYLAVSSDRVEQTIHHGSIEIFESSIDDINFVSVQSFELENPFLVKFSVIPCDDLLLYILTRNPGKTLSIYKYAGASYFVETIGSSTIVNTATDLSTMKIDNQIELIAIVSGDVFIIEAVLKEY